jgi:hypothetical protein
VRIPDQVLKGVAFIGEVTHRGAPGEVFGDLCATGFFVSVPSSHFPELRLAQKQAIDQHRLTQVAEPPAASTPIVQ